MSKKEKLLEKILSGVSDKNVTYEEAVSVLKSEGFILDGGKGSHSVFRHDDGRKMTIPYHGKDVKPIYIKQIRNLLKK